MQMQTGAGARHAASLASQHSRKTRARILCTCATVDAISAGAGCGCCVKSADIAAIASTPVSPAGVAAARAEMSCDPRGAVLGAGRSHDAGPTRAPATLHSPEASGQWFQRPGLGHSTLVARASAIPTLVLAVATLACVRSAAAGTRAPGADCSAASSSSSFSVRRLFAWPRATLNAPSGGAAQLMGHRGPSRCV